MYKGKNKTALSSQQQITDAFLSLLKQNDFAAISISLICREAKVSRQTFYSLYQSKENIILDLLEKQEIFYPTENFTMHYLCPRFGFYLKGNTAFLKLLDNHKLLYLLYEIIYRLLLDNPSFLGEMAALEREYAASFMASGFMGIANIYIKSNGRQSQSELEERILGLFQGDYLPKNK